MTTEEREFVGALWDYWSVTAEDPVIRGRIDSGEARDFMCEALRSYDALALGAPSAEFEQLLDGARRDAPACRSRFA